MFPLGDDNTARRTTPVVVYGLILMNALVWLLQLTMGDAFTMGFSTVPYEITHGTDLVGVQRIEVGGEVHPLRHFPGPTPIYLTLLTSMFMHGGWMHIIGNMVYLWTFGDQIEDELGHGKFLLFYLLCGLAAGLAQVFYRPDAVIPALGASGAIAGVLGGYLVRHPRNRVRVLFGYNVIAVPAVIVLGFWFVLQVISQVSVVAGAGGVAYMAHIGGFVTGVVLIFLFGRRRPAAAGASSAGLSGRRQRG
jgi:membrane associated rhomboid family serine protease